MFAHLLRLFQLFRVPLFVVGPVPSVLAHLQMFFVTCTRFALQLVKHYSGPTIREFCTVILTFSLTQRMTTITA